MRGPNYELRRCSPDVVEDLCVDWHGYRAAGQSVGFTYSFAVFEGGVPVAAYAWRPAALFCARSVAPSAPGGALSLSRMVAVPRSRRRLNHVSRPLRRQMKRLIDRSRWPVLVTFHDVGLGHTGHVYKCSGWSFDRYTKKVPVYTLEGRRVSAYSNGSRSVPEGASRTTTTLGRWVHRACPRGQELAAMTVAGWRLEPIPGKRWRSGAQAHRWVRVDEAHLPKAGD